MAESIGAVWTLTGGPIGVNLFVPQPCIASDVEVEGYRRLVEPLAAYSGVEPGHPRPNDDGLMDKLDIVADLAPEAVSFICGCPERAVLDRLRARGVLTIVTISCVREARQAVDAGPDALVVQGPEAGGHRSVFDPAAPAPTDPLAALPAQTVGFGVPVVAAGGLGDGGAVRRVLDAGAVAAQVGTALLLCEEAGTSAVHRGALQDPRFTETVVTRAFSGRYARSRVNDFTESFSAAAPPGYPQLKQITGPIRAAAAATGDPQSVSLWACTAWRGTRAGRAADVVAALAP